LDKIIHSSSKKPFFISGSNTSVEVWSDQRIPFEPKGWLKDLRTAIQDKIKSLSPHNSNFLYSKFVSSTRDTVDLDNVLFYNIGYSNFSHLPLNRIIMERSFVNPIPDPNNIQFPHYHLYSLEKNDLQIKSKKEVGKFTSIPISNLNSQKVDGIWYAIKKGNISTTNSDLYRKKFGIKITISSPNLRLTTDVGMKRVIDGVIASFQAQNGYDDETSKRLALNLGINKNQANDMISDDTNAILGKDNLLSAYRNGIKWNPADDLLVSVDLNLKQRFDNLSTINGQIYSVE